MAKKRKKDDSSLSSEGVPKAVLKKVAEAGKKDVIDDTYPYDKKMKGKDYETEKECLQIELLKLQRHVNKSGERVVLLFEGRDAAGKGGTIKRFMEHLNPRSARIVALAKPTETEAGQWYFQRYVEQFPTDGEMVFFDRSWYNRAVVEPVMGFCTPEEQQIFLREAPQLENIWVNDGLKLFKFWFSVSRAEQWRRFKAREKDVLKQWKLSPVDLESLDRWDDYTEAKEAMFAATDTTTAPWAVVRSDDKKRARLACMRHVLHTLAYSDKDDKVAGPPDATVLGPKEQVYPTDEW
ncbi:polyphosphate kinase 2 [soil metagenome]